MANQKQKVFNQEKKQRVGAVPAFIPWYEKNSFAGLVTGITIMFVVLVRLRLLSLPLERDEGEYAYMGQLLLKGFAPFTHAYNMKFPGTSMMYALFMLMFGQSSQSVHLALLLINAATIILLFILVRKYFGNKIAAITAISYALFTISPSLLGTAAHATHFVIFFVISGIYFLLMALKSGKSFQFFISGLLLGLAVLMKQPGVLFVLFGAVVFIYCQLPVKKDTWTSSLIQGISMAAGMALPLAFLFVGMYASGVFDKFWFWTFSYGSQYASENNFSKGMENLKMFGHSLTTDFLWLWILAAAGLIFLWMQKWPLNKKLFVFTLFIFSFISVCPGFYFRGHYFVLVAPVAGLLCGISIDCIHRMISNNIKSRLFFFSAEIIFVVSCLAGIFQLRDYLFTDNMLQVSRRLYGSNPFPEAIPVARYIKGHTTSSDRIAVIASEPEIYFLSDRISSTGYIYTYSLVEDQPYNLRMQDEMIAEIEASKPEIFVFCKVPQSWALHDNLPDKIFDWAASYATENYDLVGAVEIPDDLGVSSYNWDAQAKIFQPVTGNDLYIFRKKRNDFIKR